MSAKKSFDLERKPVQTAKKPAARKPAARSAPARAGKPRTSLRERRQAARNLASTFVYIGIALVVVALIYGLWRPEVRIMEVTAQNVPEADGVSALAKETISGKYVGILPRDSVFFYPEKEVRAAVLQAYPALGAVSVSRTSFASISIIGTRRVAAFYWCGESAAAFTLTGSSCYEADTAGLVFARAADIAVDATSSAPLLRIYAPLEGGSGNAVGSMVVGAEYLSNLLQFVKAVKTLGVPVLSTFIHEDEAELFVTPETRVRYVLGREDEAAKNAEAAFPNLNLLDGTIEYVDLRFDGKVYVKRYLEN